MASILQPKDLPYCLSVLSIVEAGVKLEVKYFELRFLLVVNVE